jgi:hypothetical protein
VGSDPFDGIHMHDITGEVLGGGDLVSVLQAMDKDATFSEDAVTFGDSAKLVIPRGMTIRQAITSLFSYWFNQQQPTTFRRTFRYRPHDGAHAAYRVLKKTYGFVDGKPTESFFGSTPPQMITVHTGVNDTVSVPWGELRVSALADAVITFSEDEDDTLGTVFHMTVTAPRRLESNIEMLFAAIEMELKEHSIYRGKLIKVGRGTEPKFVDVTALERECKKAVYSAGVKRMLNANLWAPMRRTEEFRRRGLPLKQGVLAHGTFGTGKSLAGGITALIAVENNWTAILAESGDDLRELLELAAMYGPAFVFCEDIDTVASTDSDEIEEMLEAFDGVVTKGREVLLLATTNHIGLIHAGMMRPGRFDVLIEIGIIDVDSIEGMVKQTIPAHELESGIDYAEVAAAMTGFTPAFAVQAIERAQKYAMLDGDVIRLGTQHFVEAAAEMREHEARMAAAGTKPERPSIDGALGEVIDRRVVARLGEFRIDGRPGTGRLVHEPVNNTAH